MKKFNIILVCILTILFGVLFYWYSNFSFSGRCNETQIKSAFAFPDQFKYRNAFAVPIIKYQSEDEYNKSKFFALKLIVRKNGTIKCYRLGQMETAFDFEQQKDIKNPPDKLKDILKAIPSWRFKPVDNFAFNTDTLISLPIWSEVSLPSTQKIDNMASVNFEVTLGRSGCYGICPVYSVKLNSNGKVQFVGKYKVRKIGKVDFSIEAGAVKAIFNQINENQLWNLKQNYGIAPVDAPTVFLTIKIGEKEHYTEHPDGISNYIPYSAIELENMIDEIPQIKELIGPRSEFQFD